MNEADLSHLSDYASRYGVHPEIHPDDFLFKFLCDPNVMPSVQAAIDLYFSDGQNSAQKLRQVLTQKLGMSDEPFSLLDFASGYGMVARHYRNAFPKGLDLTTCDIHPEANNFNSARIGCETIQSTSYPEDLKTDRTFDVVFCLSFFSHIGPEYFQRWLIKLYSLVREGGYLVFTAHSRFTPVGPGQDLAPGELVFVTDSEQKDLDPNLYGLSYSTPEYVFGALRDIDPRGPEKYRVAFYSEAFWWEHQDIYAIAKS